MLTVTGLWFDHERTPVGLDHTPVFGWQLEGNCRNIRQTQYRLQVALTPDFAALLYDETCETGNSTAVHAAGLTLQSLQKYYARVQVWADTAAGPQQTLWSEPAVFITALMEPATVSRQPSGKPSLWARNSPKSAGNPPPVQWCARRSP